MPLEGFEMATKKRLTKKQREAQQKDALRKRLYDIASGAGIDDIDQYDYWFYTTESLVRLIRAVDDAFDSQTEKLGNPDGVLTAYWQLSNYECLNTLTDWMFNSGYRA